MANKKFTNPGIPLTQGKVALVSDEDYNFFSRFKWHARKTPNGTFYAARVIYSPTIEGHRKSKLVLLHKEILQVPAGEEVDHRDRDGLNNLRSNLRRATTSQNQQNRVKRTGTSSCFKGVSFNQSEQKWKASIRLNGKAFHLGYFLDELKAARAYDTKAKEFFGEFARLNVYGK